MNPRRKIRITTGFCILASLIGAATASANDERAELLKVREAVWRAWFANDTKTLNKLVPPDTIVISGGEEKWKNQAVVFSNCRRVSGRRRKAHPAGVPTHRNSALWPSRNHLE